MIYSTDKCLVKLRRSFKFLKKGDFSQPVCTNIHIHNNFSTAASINQKSKCAWIGLHETPSHQSLGHKL